MAKADIKWLGNLSRIKFDGAELKKMEEDMSSIMELMDSLLTVDPVDYEDSSARLGVEALRSDVETESFAPELLISQSKGADDNCFIIPKLMS